MPNQSGMYQRVERRMTGALLGLTLRKAVGLIVAVAAILAVLGAFLVHAIDPSIGTLGNALWWSVSTVSTVGYGDVVPTSAGGRFVGVALMLTGLSLIPLITSVVVSILVSQRTHEAREAELEHLDRIYERLGALERRFEAAEE
jgi:voltage-gated potassium channel